MKTLILITVIILSLPFVASYCESQRDPYEIGSHWDYEIICENGFIYKSRGRYFGAIQILNSDGTPLKCGEKIY